MPVATKERKKAKAKKTRSNGRTAKTTTRGAKTNGRAAARKAPASGGKPKETTEQITIPAIQRRRAVVRLVGDTPVITHRFSDKAQQQIADKEEHVATAGRGKRDPKAEYEAALYKMPGRRKANGMPAAAFKSAAVDACTFIDSKKISKVWARGAFHVLGNLVEIEGVPTMVQDTVRLPNGSGALRYRPYFNEWAVEILVEFNEKVISLEQIVNLLNIAGFSVGVGDWRPQRNGSNGMFHVAGGE